MMAYNSKSQKSGKKLVEETHDLWKTYSKKREVWANHAQEDREFRLGKQWTADQKRLLEERGQAPLVVNRIHPAVEAAKALITANKPQFRVSPREDSDNSVAQAINGLLEYIWQISEGNTVLRRIVDDYYVTGLGYILVYQDPMADYNRGEVKIKDLDPMDVFVDPNSRDRYFNDAENINSDLIPVANAGLKLFVSEKGSEVRKNLLLSLVKDDKLELKDAEKLLSLLRNTFSPLKLAKSAVQNIISPA